VELSQGTELNSTLVTGSRTVLAKGTVTKETVTANVDMEDEEVIFEMEKGTRMRPPPPTTKPKYRSRWMRRQQTTTMGTQTRQPTNLEAIEKKRETDLQAEILSGSLCQERLKKQLQECLRNRRQASATATSVDGGTSCRGAITSRRSAGPEEDNTDDWQAELLHDVDEETFEKLDNIAADIDEMASRERWLFCRSCKLWHTVPCSRTSSKFLVLSILGLLLQTRPINATEIQGKGDYSITDLHGVAVFEHRYDAVLDASTSIIMIEMPFLRLRAEMGKLRTAMEKASKEYDRERELYAGLEEELSRFKTMLSSTVELFTVKNERKARTLAEWLGGLLGLYNTVKVKQIDHKEDSTRDALKTALVHLNAMDLHEKEEEKLIGQVIDKLEDTRSLMLQGSRPRQAKKSWPKVWELVQAFIKV
jgi:hypothetical protein